MTDKLKNRILLAMRRFRRAWSVLRGATYINPKARIVVNSDGGRLVDTTLERLYFNHDLMCRADGGLAHICSAENYLLQIDWRPAR